MKAWGSRSRIASVLLFAGACVSSCGGGSESDASDCFNAQLFSAGTAARLDYQIAGYFAGSGTSYTGTRTRVVNVAATGAATSGVNVVTDTSTSTNPPAPGQSNIVRTRELVSLEGREIVTSKVFQSFSFTGFDNEIETVYQPPLRDKRFTLRAGESFTLVRNDAASTITYAGQESVAVPAGTYAACKFQELAASGALRTTWVAKGQGVIVKSVAGGETEELLGSSRLAGQPI